MGTDAKISLHHVGARWGNHSFPIPPAFENDFVLTMYEADIDAIPAIYEATRGRAHEVVVLPFCLASEEGTADLHIYVNPGLNSLRRVGTTLHQRYRHLLGVDFDHDGGTRLLERRPVKTHSLDGVLAVHDGAIPGPDFLSLDIQAGEYEALLGAEKALRDSICGLIVEVEFGEMYVGQKRFQEVFDLLDDKGYQFVRFLSLGEAFGPAAPLGFRLQGYQGWADALFLRRPETFVVDAALTHKLRKLCFVAIVFGMVELAVECLDHLREVAPSAEPAALPLLTYERFVLELAALYREADKLLPPRFSEVLPADRIGDFARAADALEWPRILGGLGAYDDPFVAKLDNIVQTEETEFEGLLRRYGLHSQADGVRDLRRRQASGVLRTVAMAR